MMNEDKIRKSMGLIVIIAVAAIVVVTAFAGFIIDYLWFNSLQYASVFWTMKLTGMFYFALFTVLGFAVLYGNFWLAQGFSEKEGKIPAEGASLITFDLGEYTEPLKQLTGAGAKRLPLLAFLTAAGLAVFIGLTMAPQWETFLRYFKSVPFGKTDPLFGQEIGFYVFTLPVYKIVRGWLFALVVFSFLGSGLLYWFGGMFQIAARAVSLAPKAKMHLYGLVAAGLVLKAWDYRLQMYDLLYSEQGMVMGAGYTDYYIQRLALWVLLLYMLALMVFTLKELFSAKNRTMWLVIALILTLPVIFVLQGVLPGLVQQMIVKPNELTKEEPFIKNSIEMTNAAYGLTDITVKPFPVEDKMTLADVRLNEETVNNIRLWDAAPLLSTYQQIQSIRTYYTFYNVDVDRYLINGKVRQMMVAARELEKAKLPVQAQTWVNTRLTYTHGYGIVMNPVNSITPEGLPELFLQDIPPISKVGLKIDNPAIYFGEETATQPNQARQPQAAPGAVNPLKDVSDYVIVKTKNPEFDYASGDENKYVTYRGDGGVWMGSLFRRLLFAWGFKDLNILLTSSTTADSRIMFRRDIQERISHLAPFLVLDRDPYIVLSNGRLFWMQDAYTYSSRYPYSAPVTFSQKRLNYIRNAVKIVVDAYNGKVDFYLMDEKDPIIKTYQKIFPGLLKPFAAMPDDLKAHIRYPRDLFQVQVLLYNTYHMKDPKVFYNKEDLWTIPKEKYGSDTVPVEPYYTQMKLPGEAALEFIQLIPLTPNNKDNMIAWFAARSDGKNYGQLLVYKFPKEKLVYGPSQIEARIDQDTIISQQFSLWDQRGSSIIRGNMLVIPVNNSLLYVEPIYLKAEQRELPELKRVIVSHSGEVVMGLNLQDAIEKVFGGKLSADEQKVVQQAPQIPLTALEDGDVKNAVQGLTDHFGAARQALAEGNWTKYGAEMAQAEELLRQLQQKYGVQK